MLKNNNSFQVNLIFIFQPHSGFDGHLLASSLLLITKKLNNVTEERVID